MSPKVRVELRRRPLSDYDYVRFLTRSQLAWEYLRRNREYRHDWRLAFPRKPQNITLSDGTEVVRLRCRHWRAEAWGLRLFR